MANLRCYKFFLFALFLFLISSCVYPISKELRQEATKEIPFPMVLQNPTAYVGSIVIWGGKIIETHNIAGGSEIVVLETPLDYQEMPEAEKYSQGRFIAKTPKYLDPETYKHGRRLTVAGEIVGKEVKPLGNTEYTYPVVMIKEIHLWRRYRVYAYPYPYPYYGYGWGWQGPWPYDYWGPYDDWDEGDDWD